MKKLFDNINRLSIFVLTYIIPPSILCKLIRGIQLISILEPVLLINLYILKKFGYKIKKEYIDLHIL
jgi:hypothetical protein